MEPRPIEIAAAVLFGGAVLHTFLCGFFKRAADRYPEGSLRENLFHLLGEVEIVFGFWAGVLLLLFVSIEGSSAALAYADSRSFREPLFVFAIMTVAATRPILDLTERIVLHVAKWLPMRGESAYYLACLVLGPLAGSLITEPAAMTVTALILGRRYFDRPISTRFKYITLAVLFVNVSIGGVLTPYAAPPVLMVAGKWGWDLQFMFATFGWKTTLAAVINTALATGFLSKELRGLPPNEMHESVSRIPVWLSVMHVVFLALIVLNERHPVIFLGVLMFFLGAVVITREFQDELKLKESLLVSFFLAGLVMLGGLQQWWLQAAIAHLNEFPLFLGAAGLTAFTDNAALTYLGSQVEGVSEGFKYALMAGAVAGGGLTVIANAPNPAGYAILQERFGREGINPLWLFLAALPFTLIGMICLWLF
ncbi:MAG TPA: putative Na+/H+ antiporter [Bdellovibrionota bacterium]|nr:putative Na+/H+ antiporter [Bdellovibrionota bacterium]